MLVRNPEAITMTVVSGEKQCEEIIMTSRRQCNNAAFATIQYPDGGLRINVCRLHLAYRAAAFKKDHVDSKAEVTAINMGMQNNADSLVEFLTLPQPEHKKGH